MVVRLLYDDDANCLGFCFMQHPKPDNPDFETNKDRIYVEPVVLAPYRRQGVGTQFLGVIQQYAQKVGASWVQWDTKFDSGHRFSQKIGATEAGRQRTNRLSVDEVDWDLMQRWVAEGRSRNRDVELIRFTNLPAPDLIGPFCDLVTDVNRLQPRDDVEGIEYTLTPEELQRVAKQLIEERVQRVVLCSREPNPDAQWHDGHVFQRGEPNTCGGSTDGCQA